MEKREFCIDFIKGSCELKGNCKYAHVIVPEKEVFLKTYETKKNMKVIGKDDEEVKMPTFTLIDSKNGTTKKWLSTCITCAKGHYFAFEIERGSPESLYCTNCIGGYYQKTYKDSFM